MPKIQVVYLLLLAAAIVLVYQSCNHAERGAAIAESSKQEVTYLGDAACTSCHAQQVESWEESHHYHAMELPNNQTVLADWKGSFVADSMRYTFFKEDGIYVVTVEQDSKLDTLEVAYTFGFKPLQQFLVKADKGRLQTLRATWDTEKKEWYNQFAGDIIPEHDWLHFTNQSANWNSMCATCHSTDVTIGYNESTEAYKTEFSVINVSCESCHGPASLHVELANKNHYSPDSSGFNLLEDELWADANMCGGCHARREQLIENVQPGTPFHDAYNLTLLDERFYFPDGQIREEDYVLTSFLSSKMYSLGVRCADCHNSHSGHLKFDGNRLCRQCHEPEYDSPAHHFHEIDTEGAQCVNCHMDGRTYMGNDYRRDHSFRNPRPDQSIHYDTPNACANCHDAEGNEWAAQQVEKWYGKTRIEHFSDKLLSGWVDGKHEDLVSLAANTSFPAISRATAIHYLGMVNLTLVAENIATWMQDPNPLVRRAAIEAIRSFPPQERLVYINRAVKDEFRSVRVEAIKSSLDIEKQAMNPAYKSAYSRAESEYELYLHMISDFPEGQGQIAHSHFQKGEYQQAIEAYKRALEIDSLRFELRINLAIAYNVVGKNNRALKQLNRVLLQQESAQAYYLRGLLQAEMNRLDVAAIDLNRAIEMDDTNPQYFYNLTLTYSQSGKRELAKSTLQKGLQLHPYNERLRSLISSI